jgi:hypothetical protein
MYIWSSDNRLFLVPDDASGECLDALHDLFQDTNHSNLC